MSEHGDPGWNWIGGFEGDPLTWRSFSAKPRFALERRITRSRISRYRAALEGTLAAREAALVVTHEARVAAWVGSMHQAMRLDVPHLAVAFTFSQLPGDLRRRAIARAVRAVDRFVCFSSVERARYADVFGIPIEKIDVLRWSVAEPQYNHSAPPIEEGEYLCAIGGEGRDVATLLAAMERLPHRRLALVTRPANVEGLTIPENVSLRTNIPLADVWNIARHARLHALPLRDAEVPCGHSTLIMCMQLGTPSVVTESKAMTDYTERDRTAVLAPPADPDALAASIERLWDDDILHAGIVERGRRFALEECSEDATIAYFRRYLAGLGLGSEVGGEEVTSGGRGRSDELPGWGKRR